MPVAASRGLHLQVVLDPEMQPGSLADGLRLRQILFNLAGNALKFTRHGHVELRLQVLQQHARGQRLRLQVSDSGVGISEERQQAVFAAMPRRSARPRGASAAVGWAWRSAASWQPDGAELQRSSPGGHHGMDGSGPGGLRGTHGRTFGGISG